ncbi:hypothetical protein ACFQ2M_19485 [Kitasatospora saccharophila]
MTYSEFAEDYKLAAAVLFQRTNDPIYRGAVVAENSFTRWKGGDVSMPRRPAPRILEEMFKLKASELFGPCSDEQVPVLLAVPVLDESDLRMTARSARAHATDAAAQLLWTVT